MIPSVSSPAAEPALASPVLSDRIAPRLVLRLIGVQVWLAACAVFCLALGVRLVNLRQPLLENFIDRQVHTAMMARHVGNGGSIFYPEIDVGPFPAYYMLEFPGYPAMAAGAAAVTGLPLDTAGRLVSALAMALACLLLFDLVRRHDGLVIGLLAGATLALMPVTIRYGRAFQPDSMMFALLIAAVWATDRWAWRGSNLAHAEHPKPDASGQESVCTQQGKSFRGPGFAWLVLATLATAAALLLKVISAYVLIPLAYLAWWRHGRSSLRRWELWVALAVIVLPSLAWYVHAWRVASGPTTVSTPFWHAHKWVAPQRVLELSTYRQLAYYVGLRVLTPIGLALAVIGAMRRTGGSRNEERGTRNEERWTATENFHGPQSSVLGPRDLLFHVWLGSLVTFLPILIRKLDHEHYYLALAPPAAVFIARALVAIARAPLAGSFYVSGRTAAIGLAAALVASDLLACASTFRTPGEWEHVTSAAAAVRECTPSDALVAAGHPSVLFYGERRGFSMLYRPHEIQFLFETWGTKTNEPTPARLLDFYRSQGAEYFVELLEPKRQQTNGGFMDHVRNRFPVVSEVPGQYAIVVLTAETRKLEQEGTE